MKIYYRALCIEQNLIATGRQHQQQPQSAPVPESQPNRLLADIPLSPLSNLSPRVADQEPVR